MEWERKMYRSCVDPALEVMEQVGTTLYPSSSKYPIHRMYLDLRFFKMFFWGLAYEEDDWHFSCFLSAMRLNFRQSSEEFQNQFECASNGEKISNWEPMSYQLQRNINKYKPQARQICHLLLFRPSKCKPCQPEEFILECGEETASFIDLIRENLHCLESKIDLTSPVKKQIASIEGKLEVFGRLVKFAYIHTLWPDREMRLSELISCYRIWANQISYLACLYWIDYKMDASFASRMANMLSDLLQFYTPEITLFHNVIQTNSKSHDDEFEVTMTPQILARYVDSAISRYHQHLILPTRDDIQTLRDGLIFLFLFLMDSPKERSKERESVLPEIYAIIRELSSVICIPGTKLPGFLCMIDRVMAQVRELYVVSPISSHFNSPMVNARGFLDSLLGRLKKMLEQEVGFIPFVQHRVEAVQEELASLRLFMQDNLTALQHEHKKLKDLWIQLVDTVYHAAYVVNLCTITNFSVWYGIICLPIVIQGIKLVKSEIKNIEDDQMCGNEKLTLETESTSTNALLPHVTTSKNEGVFIGFVEDARSILDYLLGGRKDLTIISISGMPGLGKTTIAKRIYNDPSIQYHFHRIAWCYVSKECDTTQLLANIVGQVTNVGVKLEIHHDLAECLWKSLRKKRYLIVLDDIWEVDVWCQVQRSFPNDSNGSRIIFTSRNHDLARQAKPDSISHLLRLFSDEESWELMKDKICDCNDLPSKFVEIGKQIAFYCKGLPLAAALIASHLKRIPQKLDLWRKVAENLKSHLSSEGCMHIIELSYNNLSDHLKPCFLYIGAFPRGEDIRARKLQLLWIAEGFVNSVDLAKHYLDDLVSQNLIVVTQRSSAGGIKSCNVHDLLYDLCLEKAVEDNFFLFAEKRTAANEYYSSPQKYNFHHRLCIGERNLFTQPRTICTRKELPMSQIHCLLWPLTPGDNGPKIIESFRFFITSFKLLTILDFEDYYVEDYVIKEIILNNIHLTYLALRSVGSTIPPTIVQLWNLENLVLREMNAELPDTFWRMKSIRHVNIGEFKLQLKGVGQNESSMAAASTIETLGGIIIYYDCETEEFLGRLSRLKKLHCYYGGRKFHPKWFFMLKSLEKLQSLWISRSDYRRLLFPNQELPTLDFPDNLKKLSLSELELPWSAMSTVGKLPNLEVLKLRHSACRGSTWELGDGEFSNLRYLRLFFMDVAQIDDSDCDNPFPCLEKLLLICCPRLEEIPSSFGDICTLNTIDVSESLKATDSVRRILEQQQDMGNHNLQVFGLGHQDDDNADHYSHHFDDDDSDNDSNEEDDDSDDSVVEMD